MSLLLKEVYTFFSKEKVIWAPEKKSGYFVELREPSGVINIHAQGIDNLY